MPLVYRAMEEEDGQPKVGSEKNMLGVRVPPNPRPDIVPDTNGNVQPNSGGMSVAPNWRDLPPFLIPRRLNCIVSDARGPNRLRCWRFGEGKFESAPLSDELQLQRQTSTHGVVEPVAEVSIASFQDALAETRRGWQIDES